MPLIKEGAVEVNIPDLPDVPTRKMKVFYNPKMKLGRDLTVAMVESYGRKTHKKINAIFPLAGTGIRAFRLIRETTVVENAVINDINPNAAKIARENASRNNIKNVEIFSRDAAALMYELAEKKQKFSYIDIDPFGSPLPFLDAAIAIAKPYALLGVTATDIGTLSGIYPEKASKRYRMFLFRTPLKEEIAVRALLETVARVAATRERGIIPVLSIVSYFVRVMVIVTPKISISPGFLGWCDKCIRNIILDTYNSLCPVCKNKLKISGPLWKGPLHNREYTSCAIEFAPTTQTKKLLILASSELSTLPLVDTHYFCSVIRASTLPQLDDLVKRLTHAGYRASRSAIKQTAIRTDAPMKTLEKFMSNEPS